jgi:hypothetical protein
MNKSGWIGSASLLHLDICICRTEMLQNVIVIISIRLVPSVGSTDHAELFPILSLWRIGFFQIDPNVRILSYSIIRARQAST